MALSTDTSDMLWSLCALSLLESFLPLLRQLSLAGVSGKCGPLVALEVVSKQESLGVTLAVIPKKAAL